MNKQTASKAKRPTGLSRRTVMALAAMLAAGALLTWSTVIRTDRQMRQSLLFKARLMADALSLQSLRELSGTEADLNKPDYLHLKDQLAGAKAADKECRFLYLMGRRADGVVFFFVDSEPVGSKDESPAGQIFSEIGAEELRAFAEKVELTPGPTADRWGTWVSALLPIVDPNTGDLLAVLGIDYAARDWKQKLLRASLPPVLFTLTMIAVLAGGSAILTRRLRTAPAAESRWRHLEPTLTVAVAGLFLSMSLAWLAHQKETDARNRAFQQLAQSKTHAIAQALFTLHDAELETLAHFLGSSEYVSLKEFEDYSSYLLKNRMVRAWEWIEPVPLAGKERLELKARAEGLGGFSIREAAGNGKLTPAGGRDVYYPILRVAPLEGNERALGYDIGSEPLHRKALEAAVSSGLARCTDPVDLQGTDPIKTIAVYHPVFTADRPPRLRGFAAAVLRMEDVLKSGHPNEAVSLELAIVHRDSSIEVLAMSGNDSDPSTHRLCVTLPVFVFGKTFLLTGHVGRGFMKLYPTQAGGLVALAGLMLTALLAVLTSRVFRERERLEAMVSERTHELAEARDRTELAIEGADLGTWDWNVSTNEVILNENWARMVGLPLDEARQPASALEKLVHPADLPDAKKAMTAHLQAATESYEMEHRLLHKAGHYIWVLVKGRVLKRNTDGNPLHVCGTYLDITQRKTAEEALKTSKTQLRMLLDTLPDLIWLKDPAGVYVTCNKRFERFFGAPEPDIVGKTDQDFLEQELVDFFRKEDEAAIAAGKPTMHEEEITYADDGHKELLETIRTPVYDSHGKLAGVLGIARDITDRRRMEQERQKLQGQLLHAQKMEAVGRLAGGVAHDLNNLLAPIIGYGEMLLADLDSQDARHKRLGHMLSAALRARDLVRQLLTFSRKQPMELKPVSINKVIEDFKKLLQRTIPEDVEIVVTGSHDVLPVLADVGQIEQVIMNLAVNAADAMPNGGRLTFETSLMELDEESATSRPDLKPGRYVVLSVSDTGCGMDDATREHIFEPFFSTKGESGTGLGLATVFGIVKQHGGSIWVYSEPENGATFRIYLPVFMQAPDEKRVGPETTGASTGTETILLVEDNEEVRRLARALLERQGYHVVAAENGLAALTIMDSHEGPIHLLLTDVVMPGMNGKELHQEVTKKHANIKVLYMSGYTDSVIAHRGVLEAGAEYIQKPFTIRDLAAKVRQAIDL